MMSSVRRPLTLLLLEPVVVSPSSLKQVGDTNQGKLLCKVFIYISPLLYIKVLGEL